MQKKMIEIENLLNIVENQLELKNKNLLEI